MSVRRWSRRCARICIAAAVSTQTQKLGGTVTAGEMLNSMILLRQENEQALKDLHSRQATMESQCEANKYSVLGAG
jgi:hypothetical protein